MANPAFISLTRSRTIVRRRTSHYSLTGPALPGSKKRASLTRLNTSKKKGSAQQERSSCTKGGQKSPSKTRSKSNWLNDGEAEQRIMTCRTACHEARLLAELGGPVYDKRDSYRSVVHSQEG